ncbi:MAG: ImmA/IrrE family metallo-endopeptidase [Desulfitobacteriaceae bacterium]|nr:ImmA/IrrE family metallo-endopeptidase [Desulfitobacteriaceae bacterium]
MLRPKHVRRRVAVAAARIFLCELGLKYPPVDAKWAVKQLARLFYFSHPEDDGFTLYNAVTGEYMVYINADLPDARMNWTYAHETGHIRVKHLLHYDCNNLNERERWILDREADIFTSEFLMPKGWVKKYVTKPVASIKELAYFKELFSVSWEALIYRLDELGIQKRDELMRLMMHEDAAVSFSRR